MGEYCTRDFTFNRIVLYGSLGGKNASGNPVLLDGKDTSCAAWCRTGNVVCLSISKGKPVFPRNTKGPNSVFRMTLSKGVPATPPRARLRKGARVEIDIHAIWVYVEIPVNEFNSNFLKNGSAELRSRRRLTIYHLANWRSLSHLSGKVRQVR